MDSHQTLEGLKKLGADTPAPDDAVRLYCQAFSEFGACALWSSRAVANPTIAAVLSITESLRVEGNREARRLAEQLEALCRAAV